MTLMFMVLFVEELCKLAYLTLSLLVPPELVIPSLESVRETLANDPMSWSSVLPQAVWDFVKCCLNLPAASAVFDSMDKVLEHEWLSLHLDESLMGGDDELDEVAAHEALVADLKAEQHLYRQKDNRRRGIASVVLPFPVMTPDEGTEQTESKAEATMPAAAPTVPPPPVVSPFSSHCCIPVSVNMSPSLVSSSDTTGFVPINSSQRHQPLRYLGSPKGTTPYHFCVTNLLSIGRNSVTPDMNGSKRKRYDPPSDPPQGYLFLLMERLSYFHCRRENSKLGDGTRR